MLRADFLKKCIIMHFLGTEKTGKALNAEFAEALRKDLRKIGEEETVGAPGPREVWRAKSISNKPLICIHLQASSPISPLLAHTS
jgi:hypothetical protein